MPKSGDAQTAFRAYLAELQRNLASGIASENTHGPRWRTCWKRWIWEFHIGGYQVCERWLKDRKGRFLTSDDIDHYQKIVVAISETMRLMREIDDLIPGWPLP